MEISIHTSGDRALIGTKSGEDIAVKSFDTRLLFQEPDLLQNRLIAFLQNKFGLRSSDEITKMCFGIHGVMHTQSGSVIHSDVLSDISKGKGFSGFSFRNLFGHLCGPENIHVVNDTVPIGLGFRVLYPEISTPVLAIMIAQHGVGISLISDQGEVIATELGNVFIPGYFRKNAHYLLVHRGVDGLLRSSSKYIQEKYTQRLIEVASHYGEISKKTLYTSPSQHNEKLNVCVLSIKDEFIDEEILQNNDSNLRFFLPRSEEDKLKIPIVGLFSYALYQNPQRTILKVEYYSRGKKIHSFENFDGLYSHWKQVKTFANPDNEYRILYSDGVVRPIKIRDLNYKIELEAYKF